VEDTGFVDLRVNSLIYDLIGNLTHVLGVENVVDISAGFKHTVLRTGLKKNGCQ